MSYETPTLSDEGMEAISTEFALPIMQRDSLGFARFVSAPVEIEIEFFAEGPATIVAFLFYDSRGDLGWVDEEGELIAFDDVLLWRPRA